LLPHRSRAAVAFANSDFCYLTRKRSPKVTRVSFGRPVSPSRRYGIDPHDASSQLLIARNEIYDMQGHGLIVSQGVSASWIVENLSRDNA
jgi:hypothetical protein